MQKFCLRVEPVFTKLYGEDWGRLPIGLGFLRDEAKYKIAGSEHFQSVKDGRWDGYHQMSYFEEGALVFPTGLLPRILEALMEKYVDWTHDMNTAQAMEELIQYVDVQTPLQKGTAFPLPVVDPIKNLGDKISLRSYQERMVNSILHASGKDNPFVEIPRGKVKHLSSNVGRETLIRNNGRGIWKSATGSGKTIASAGLIGRLGVKTLFLVYSNDLVIQTWEVFKGVLGPWLSQVGWSLGLAYEGGITEGEVMVAGTSTFVAIMARPERLSKDAETTIEDMLKSSIPFIDKGKIELFKLVREFKRVLNQDPHDLMRLRGLGLDISQVEVSVTLGALSENEKAFEQEEATFKTKVEKQCKQLFQYADKQAEALEKKRKLQSYLESVQLLILDEAHSGAADGIYRLLMSCPAPYRLAMSGTPLDRSDGENLKIIAAFGDVIANVSNKEMKEAGVVPEALIRLIEIPGKLKMFKGYRFHDVYKMGVTENQIRNRWICKLVQHTLKEKKRVLVIFKAREHGQILSEMLQMKELFGEIDFRCVDGRDSLEKRKFVIEEFRAGVVSAVLASNIFGTGINIPEGIDVMINAAGGKATIGTLQRLGRGLRGEGQVVLYDFADFSHKNLAEHSKERIKIYQSQGCFDMEVVDPYSFHFDD